MRHRTVGAGAALGLVLGVLAACATKAPEAGADVGGAGVAAGDRWPAELRAELRAELEAIRAATEGMNSDFRRPGLLIYEPQADGGVELVAVEDMIFVDAWERAGHTSPPMFGGMEYYRRHDDPETAVDEAHGFAPHYELHLYLYRE